MIERRKRLAGQIRAIAGRLLLGWLGFAAAISGFAETSFYEIDQPPHNYWKRPLQDRFTKIKEDLEVGRVTLDSSNEKAYLAGLLQALDMPASSQMLVFSTTSLQLRLISPSNPRALYFNEDIYLGFIPGGRIEIVSLDPEIGGIFYIFDIPRESRPLRIERSDRCMNCHAASETQYLPGLLIKSVIPGPRGGTLEGFRQDQTGHGIPFEQRFGGWYVTGRHSITNHWGNLVGRLSPAGLATNYVEPGERFDFSRYPAPTSDILPHLVHEHQAGFVNRALEASYRARSYWHETEGKLDSKQAKELDKQARTLTRYLLFADEAPLPAGGLEGDSAFKADFTRNRRVAANGASLKDFDLGTRLFKHRCSYMIYSAVFQGLPAPMKARIYQELAEALNVDKPKADYAYLETAEKKVIRGILKETLNDLPRDW